MTRCVNVCHGWSCTLVTKCAISDFNYEPEQGTWSRHYMEPHTDEACQNFEPLRARGWGEGPEPND
jgi:hypothetical protein